MSSNIAKKPRVDEFLLAYRGYSATPGICHVVVAPENGRAPRALVGELDDNPGTSTTNAIEEVAEAISRHLLDGSEDFSLFQYQPHGLPDLRPEFYAIEWKGGRPFRWPVWERVDASSHPWLSSVRRYVSAEDYTRDRIDVRTRVIDASRDPRVARDSTTEQIGRPHDIEPPRACAVDVLGIGDSRKTDDADSDVVVSHCGRWTTAGPDSDARCCDRDYCA